MKKLFLLVLSFCILLSSGCQAGSAPPTSGNTVLAVETFLADITRNVSGDRVKVESLVPVGMDPHAFEPAPRDVAQITDSRVLVINGGGVEEWIKPVLANAGGQHLVVEASAGLTNRAAREGEEVESAPGHAGQVDPHFWLDPLNVVKYVENIRDGLTQVDPDGKDGYAANAAAYIQKLQELDGWIRQQVDTIPPERRLLVTNHEEFGYFADRYGFKIAGTIIPSVTTGSSPSAQELARLVDHIRTSGVKAVFLESGSNTQLANQLAAETGVKVVTGLYTHSTTAPDGPAPTYIDMMKANVKAIVDALK